MSRVRHISPTSNANTDTANIKQAIDALSVSTVDRENQGIIILTPGEYRINESLVFGTIGADGSYSDSGCIPRMVGAGTVYLRWYGGETTDSMIVYLAPRFSAKGIYMQNLFIDTQYLCRGIRMHYCTYGGGIQDCFIIGKQVALEMVDCWGGFARNMRLWSTGICFRSKWANASVLESILCVSKGTDWPAIDDDTVPHSEGDIQTSAAHRAAIVLNDARGIHATNLLTEGCTTPNYESLITLHDLRQSSFQGIYFENNINDEDNLSTPGNQRLLIEGCNNINIHNIHNSSINWSDAAYHTEYTARLQNANRNVVMDQVTDSPTEAIMVCDGGSHSGHSVRNVEYWSEIPLSSYIVKANDPQAYGQGRALGRICADGDKSVSIPTYQRT